AEPLPRRFVEAASEAALRDDLLCHLAQLPPPLLRGTRRGRHADQLELRWETPREHELVERWNEQVPSQIARGAEDGHDSGRRERRAIFRHRRARFFALHAFARLLAGLHRFTGSPDGMEV